MRLSRVALPLMMSCTDHRMYRTRRSVHPLLHRCLQTLQQTGLVAIFPAVWAALPIDQPAGGVGKNSKAVGEMWGGKTGEERRLVHKQVEEVQVRSLSATRDTEKTLEHTGGSGACFPAVQPPLSTHNRKSTGELPKYRGCTALAHVNGAMVTRRRSYKFEL